MPHARPAYVLASGTELRPGPSFPDKPYEPGQGPVKEKIVDLLSVDYVLPQGRAVRRRSTSKRATEDIGKTIRRPAELQPVVDARAPFAETRPFPRTRLPL
jgi:hypothetical protein